jgi:hypothetical protein
MLLWQPLLTVGLKDPKALLSVNAQRELQEVDGNEITSIKFGSGTSNK